MHEWPFHHQVSTWFPSIAFMNLNLVSNPEIRFDRCNPPTAFSLFLLITQREILVSSFRIMDLVTALGVAAAASQFADQVFKLSDYLYDVFKSIKNAPKQSRELRQEALSLSDMLANLHSLLSSEKQATSLPKASPFVELVKEFEETIAEMAKRVEIKDGEISWKRLGWPFTQKENEKYLSKLERYKNSFQIALQTLQSFLAFLCLSNS